MASRLRKAWVAIACLTSLHLIPSHAAAAEEKISSTSAATEDPQRRCGYRPTDGGQIVGKPVVGPSGDGVAFFEQHASRYDLVVCIQGAAPARWPVTDRIAHMKIFWIGRTELVVGTELLQPTARVRWDVAKL